jgi:5-methylcytosine-specific restriction endonuclease McrA
MPVRPPRRCSTCHRLVSGPCSRCARQTNQLRGSRTRRGYDESWQRLRLTQLAAAPWCAFCEAAGFIVAADQVDHIIPFVSLEDPHRLDPANLRSLCASCHATHTRRGGVSHHGPSTVPNRLGGSFFRGQVGGGQD